MTVPNGQHRHPVANNRQHIITVENSTVVDAFIRHPDGRLEEIDRSELDDPYTQSRLLTELEKQREGGHE